MTQVWVNGQANEGVSPLDRGLAYGDGLFATMRVGEDGILFLDAHLQRLTQGAARLGFDWHASVGLLRQLAALAASNPGSCIKLHLTRGVGGRGYGAPATVDVTQIISLHALPSHYARWQRQGIRLASSQVKLGKQARLAGIKHCNRLEQVLIKSVKLPPGFDDWLVLDIDGDVIGSSMANIFFVRGKTVITPTLSHAGVSGNTREQLIHALLASGYSIECRQLTVASLANFDHVFISNSLFGVVDITAINQTRYEKATITPYLRNILNLTL